MIRDTTHTAGQGRIMEIKKQTWEVRTIEGWLTKHPTAPAVLSEKDKKVLGKKGAGGIAGKGGGKGNITTGTRH